MKDRKNIKYTPKEGGRPGKENTLEFDTEEDRQEWEKEQKRLVWIYYTQQ